MQLINASRLVADFSMATDQHGVESLVVVAKGTYGFPDHPESAPLLLERQAGLVTADEFGGEPGRSAPLFDNDFAPVKPRCDVLLNGSCHAPGGGEARAVEVALRVGTLTKAFRVSGARRYRGGIFAARADRPQPFKVVPIGYDAAYGGADISDPDPARWHWYPDNPGGVGFYPHASHAELDGKPLPVTEELNDPVAEPQGRYRPMAFGPIARSWPARARWAGTYDQRWRDEQYPFLPIDFDARYHQSAPDDQQIAYPRGGEEVVLVHLTPAGRTAFRLPADLALPIAFVAREGGITEVTAVVDTVLLEPDTARFSLVWRASLRLRRNIRELSHVRIGKRALGGRRSDGDSAWS